MRSFSLQREWPYVSVLVMSLLLGVAIAAGFDAWSDDDEATLASLFTDCKGALALAGAMVIFARFARLRLFESTAVQAPAAQAAQPPADPLQ